MIQTYHNIADEIDWPKVFESMTGSQESAIGQKELALYIANKRDVTVGDGAFAVSTASENGELLEVVVRQYPFVDRRFYFLPRVRFEDAGKVFIPFYSYVYEELDLASGDHMITDTLLERIDEHPDNDISDRTLSTIDDHLEELLPTHTTKENHSGRTLKSEESALYGELIWKSVGYDRE